MQGLTLAVSHMGESDYHDDAKAVRRACTSISAYEEVGSS
jgi:hypothetical protein